MGDRRLIEREDAGKIGDAQFGDRERRQQFQSRRIRKDGEKAHEGGERFPFRDALRNDAARAAVQKQRLHTLPPLPKHSALFDHTACAYDKMRLLCRKTASFAPKFCENLPLPLDEGRLQV